jgi:phospholipid transport system transporter-binding protein
MKLPENATLDQAPTLAQTLPAAIASGTGPFSIDASALTAFDSSTLALLLQAHRLAQAAGRGFEVQGAPQPLVQLAQLYGVDELLSLSPDAPSTPSPSPSPSSGPLPAST